MIRRSIFEPRVSFDTFDPRDSTAAADIFSYTLVRKHKDYEYTKRSRTFLCGLDTNEYSDHALEWLIDELVDDGDEIVCLRVIEKDSKIAGDASVEDGRYRDKAEALMKEIQAKNAENKAINLILEFSVGKVHKTIDDMVGTSTVQSSNANVLNRSICTSLPFSWWVPVVEVLEGFKASCPARYQSIACNTRLCL